MMILVSEWSISQQQFGRQVCTPQAVAAGTHCSDHLAGVDGCSLGPCQGQGREGADAVPLGSTCQDLAHKLHKA